MVDFLTQYGSYVLSAIIIVFDLVVFPIVKARLAKAGKAKAFFEIVEKLPSYISEAETLFDRGQSKLAYVLQKCHLDCVASGATYNEALITEYIEGILDTPQSKK